MELTGINYVEYNFSEQINGSSFIGAKLVISSNNLPVDLTGATVYLWWAYSNNKGEIVRKSQIGNGITIIDAINGTLQIDAFEFLNGEGIYSYEMKIILSNGNIKKYLKGQIVIINSIFL